MISTPEYLHQHLLSLADTEYGIFSARLIPNLHRPMMGVRIPALRKLAKELAREDAEAALQLIPDAPTHEEVLLQGFIIGYDRPTWELWKERVRAFVPRMDNWAVCDMVCASLSLIRKHREEGFDFLQPYLSKRDEFEQRFAIVMLMDHFMTEDYREKVLQTLQEVQPAGYYAAMAVGWALQAAFVKWPERVFPLLQDAALETVSRKLARKKILESLRTPAIWRERIKKLSI